MEAQQDHSRANGQAVRPEGNSRSLKIVERLCDGMALWTLGFALGSGTAPAAVAAACLMLTSLAARGCASGWGRNAGSRGPGLAP